MSTNQVLLRIHHYHYDVLFGAAELSPLANDIVVTADKKVYDGNLIINDSVDENEVVFRHEMKICVTTKYLAVAVPLLQRIADGASLPEEELKFLPHHPQGLTLKFPCARLTGSNAWKLNTSDDQSVTLEFVARAGSDGKVLKIN